MILLKNSIKLLITILVLFFSYAIIDVYAIDWYKASISILKINSYDDINWSYYIDKFGSALVIDKDTIITNAHVITREDGTPYNNYEICWHIKSDKSISCFTTAKVLYLDVQKDLAFLKFSNKYNFIPVVFSDKESKIWDSVNVYGYSFDGFGNITASHGIVSNYYNNYVWLDADIDQWDSGGWVLDSQNKVVGMPTFILLYNILWDIKKSNYMTPSKEISKFISYYQSNPTALSKQYSSYYNTSDYNKFITYVSNKQKQQSLWHIKTTDFYLLYKGYWFVLFDTTKWASGYAYVLKNTDQNVEIYLNKYINTDLDNRLAEYQTSLDLLYDDVSIYDLTDNIANPSISKYIKIVSTDSESDDHDTIYLLQKGKDLVFLEMLGDPTRQDYKIFTKKIENIIRMMIWR